MTHISLVQANVKACPEEVRLEPLTAIVGGPQRGKTSILQAITLARTGKHPGCNSKQPATYLKFAPEGADALYAHIAGEGISGVLRVTRSKPPKRTHEVSGVIQEDVIPIAAVAAELWSMGHLKMREAVFRRFSKVKGRPQPKGLDEASQALWDEVAQGIHEDGVDFLSAMAKGLGSKKREKNAAKKYVDEKIAELRGPTNLSTAGVERIPQLREDLKKALRAERINEGQAKLRTLRASIKDTEELLQGAEQNLAAATARADAAQAEMGQRRAALEELEEKAKALPNTDADQQRLSRASVMLEVLELVRKHDLGCPLCESDVGSWDEHIERVTTARDQRQALVNKADEARQGIRAEISKKLSEMSGAASVVRDASNKAQLARDSIQTRLANLRAEEKGLIAGLGEAQEYKGRAAAAIEEELTRLQELAHKRDELENLTSESLALSMAADRAKVLEGGALALVDRLVADVRHAAEDAVNDEMPPGLLAVLNLERGAEWEVVGADGRPHGKDTLCGNELAALRTALALTWTKGSGEFRCLLLDADADLSGLHGEVFRNLLHRLAEKQRGGELHQVVITWPHLSDIPDGWHVVDLGGA